MMMLFHLFVERLSPIFLYMQSPLLGNIILSMGIIWTLGVLATFLIARNLATAKAIPIIGAEIVGFVLLGIGSIMPTKYSRFICGLLTSANFVTIHSRVCDSLQSKKPKNTSDIGFSELFLKEFYKTQSYLVSPHVHRIERRLPSISEVFSILCTDFFLELNNYGIREYVPLYIEEKWQFLFIAILGLNWVLLVMNLNYFVYLTTAKCLGFDVPIAYRHVHPGLSTSFSEFWGIRWNPVIGKCLKDAYYIPFRRLGCPRFVCVLICFTGSGLLHCIPQYFSTADWTESGMMFSFFFLHGVIVLAESVFQSMVAGLHPASVTEKVVLPQPAEAETVQAPPAGLEESFQRAKLLPLQLLTECSLTVATVALPYFLFVRPVDSSALASASSLSLSVPVMLLPFSWPSTAWVEVDVPLSLAWLQAGAVAVTAVAITGFLVGRLALLSVRGTGKGGNKAGLMQRMGLDIDVDAPLVRRLLWSTAGWLWVVAGSLLTAPLFSIPALSACSEFYPRSYFFGAVVETAATFIRINSPGLVT